MTRALFITNPAAARTEDATVRAVLETLQRGGWTVELRTTSGPGDARRFASEAVAEGLDVVVVFGGDGTTMQAAAALVGTETALGLIPGGTGNLLAGNLRIPSSPARAARALLDAQRRPIDLGRVMRADGLHYFAVACGAGYDARVMAGTTTEHKHRWRFAAYVATTFRLLPLLRSTRHLITVDGTRYEAPGAMVLVANCSEVIPPYVKLRSGIAPDDGLLDVIVMHADGFFQGVRAIWELLRDGQPLGSGSGPVRHARGRRITIATDADTPVQLDGEPLGVTPFTVDVVPHAIRVLVPATSR